MYHEFRWRGELIPDIDEWAKQHNEEMIHYKATRKVVNPYTSQLYEESYTGRMPISFYFTLAASNGWMYQMIKEPE